MAKQTGTAGRLAGNILLFLNILAIIWLALCYSASVINPNRITGIALFSLTTPFAIGANVLFVIAWLPGRGKLRSLLSLASLVLCNSLIFQVFAFNFFATNDMQSGEHKLKLMIWNVHGMGIFDKKGNTNAYGIIKEIKREQPDIVCMEEYTAMNDDSLKPYGRAILREGNFKQYWYRWDNGFGPYILLGNAVFTKYPVVAYQYYALRKYIYLVQLDLQVDSNKIIRLFCTHLSSFKLSETDKKYVWDAKHQMIEVKPAKIKAPPFLAKLVGAYNIRAEEADSIATIIKQSPYPVIMCGDLNDLPASYAYHTIRGHLCDAFLNTGKGVGRTYRELAPTLRIDHVFYDDTALTAIGYKIPKVDFSDHYPVVVNFDLK